MPTPRRQAALPKDAAANSDLSRRAPRTNILPPQLQSSVPPCARQCVLNYINHDFDCPDNDFSCLCSHYSSTGLTLGESGYICLHQSCEKPTQAGISKAYDVCDTVPGAVRPTHSTITLPPATTSRNTPKPTGPATTPTGQNTQAPFPQTTASHTPVMPESMRGPTKSGPSSMAPTASAGAGTLPPATGAAEHSSNQLPSTSLTHGQAAGISIAAMGTIMLAIGAIYLVIYLRRRKVKVKDERNSYDFVDEAPPRFSPFNYGYADPRGPLGGFEKRRAELGAEKHMTHWPGTRMSYDDYAARYNEKSISVSPASRPSNESLKDKAQQLPAKPAPLVTRGLPSAPAPSPNTATTVFEEDKTPIPTVPRKPLPKLPAARLPPAKLPPAKLPPAGTAIHYPPPPPTKPKKVQYAGALMQSPGRTHQPPLSLQIPRQATRAAQLPSNNYFPLPPEGLKPALVLPPPPPGPFPLHSTSARNSDNSVLDYYTSPDPGQGPAAYDTSPDIDLPTPLQVEARRRRAAPPNFPVTKPTQPPPPPRPLKRHSTASDTSFESLNTDEPTPPSEEPKDPEVKQLTPVLESPLAGVRYPKVPRSSNQSVPRSPKLTTPSAMPPKPQTRAGNDRFHLPSNVRPQQHAPQYPPVTPERKHTSDSSSLSGTTLAAKRRGDSAAMDLERRFYVAGSAYSRAGSQATTSHSSTQSGELYSGESAQSRSTQTTASPLKGYGRVAAAGGRMRPAAHEAGLGLQGIIAQSNATYGDGQGQKGKYPGLPRHPKALVDDAKVNRGSEHWEPKLTPSRRGEDLFLSVGVATPRRDVFRM